jgi:uncharacterized membrane protein
MSGLTLTTFAETSVLALEIGGVGVVLIGVCVATVVFLRDCLARAWTTAYDRYRSNLGRGILLGLEFLVAADIIATVAAPLSFETVGALAVIVLIRTLLSFALETEIEGRFPWKRAEAGEKRD